MFSSPQQSESLQESPADHPLKSLSRLHLHCLGAFKLEVDGAEAHVGGAQKKALLSILAYEVGTWVSRSTLLRLLWPRVGSRTARHSLSQSLYSLRLALPAGVLEIETERVRLPGEIWKTDLGDLRLAVRQNDWPTTLATFAGDFLEHVVVDRSPEFEQWRDLAAARIRGEFADFLKQTADRLEHEGSWNELGLVSERWLSLEPCSLSAVRTYALALGAQGRSREALGLIKEKCSSLPQIPGISTEIERLTRRLEFESGTDMTERGHGAPSFVARKTEFQQLRQSLCRAFEAGGLEAILLTGEPGIGKTRLMDRVGRLAILMGGRVLRVSCCPAEVHIAYCGIAEAFRDTTDHDLAEIHESHRACLSHLIPVDPTKFAAFQPYPSLDAAGAQARLIEAVTALTLSITRSMPTALLVDDIQWIDESSAAAIQHILKSVEDQRLFVLASAQPTELATRPSIRGLVEDNVRGGRMRVTELAALTRAEAQDLLDRWQEECGVGLDPEISANIIRHAEGNPFLLLQLLSAAKEGELELPGLSSEAGFLPGHVNIPAALTAFLQRKLAQASSGERDLLRACAIIGRPVQIHALARIMDLSPIQAAALADELIRRGVLVAEAATVRCSHQIFLESIYQSIPPLSRTVLHGRFAECLWEDGEFGLAAIQYSQAADEGRAFECAVTAAQQGLTRGAPREAEFYLRLAVRHAPTDALRVTARRKLAEFLFSHTSYDEARSLLLELGSGPEMPRLSPDERLQIESLKLAAAEAIGSTAPEDLRKASQRLLVESAAMRDQKVQVDLLGILMRVALHTKSLKLLWEIFSQVEDRLTREPRGDCELHLLGANCALFLGNRDVALDHVVRAVAESERADQVVCGRAYNLYGLVLAQHGRFREAESALLRSIDVMDSIGATNRLYLPISNLGVVYMDQDRFDLADRELQRLVDQRRWSTSMPEILGWGNLALIAYEKHDLQVVEDCCARIFKAARPEYSFYVESAQALLGLARWESGFVDEAVQIASSFSPDPSSLVFSAEPAHVVILRSRILGHFSGPAEGATFLRGILESRKLRSLTTEWQVEIELAKQLGPANSDAAISLSAKVVNEAISLGGYLYARKAEAVVRAVS